MRLFMQILISAVLVSAFPVQAQDAEREGVREYLRLSQAAEQLRAGIKQAIADNPSKPVPPLFQKILALKDEEIEEVMVPVYLEAWGQENVKAISEFFKSPAGIEMITKSLQSSRGANVKFSPETQSALQRFSETPAGRAFFRSGAVVQQKVWPAIQRYVAQQK
jgi:hypothetical protein